MDTLFPIITVTDLQRSTKAALKSVKDYAVVRSHRKDVGLLLHPDLGRVLLESGMLRDLLARCARGEAAGKGKKGGRIDMRTLDHFIGNVLLELSKQ